MTITRANCEVILVKRLKVLMEAAELAVTFAGLNDDLSDPLAWAMRMIGETTDDPTTTTDAELSGVAVASYDDLINLAEYRTLQNILGNLDLVDINAGPRAEKLSQLADQVRQMLKAWESLVVGFTTAVSTGYLSLDFAEHGEATL